MYRLFSDGYYSLKSHHWIRGKNVILCRIRKVRHEHFHSSYLFSSSSVVNYKTSSFSASLECVRVTRKSYPITFQGAMHINEVVNRRTDKKLVCMYVCNYCTSFHTREERAERERRQQQQQCAFHSNQPHTDSLSYSCSFLSFNPVKPVLFFPVTVVLLFICKFFR